MKRHVSHSILSALVLAILLIPTTTTLSQHISGITELVEPTMKGYDYADQASDWLHGWENRKLHEITGTPGAGTNYQVKVVVHYGIGLDSGENVYCSSLCQPDFDDIRFTDNDKITLLDYWTESVYISDNATFWVEVRDNLDIDSTIYIYYGNSTVSSISNGTTTFIFFDDFESGNFDKWDDVGISCSIESSTVYSGSFSALLPGGGSERHLWKNTDARWNATAFMVHVAARLTYSGDHAGYPVYWQGYSNTSTLRYGYSLFGDSLTWSYGDHTGGDIPWATNNSFSTDMWYGMKTAIDVTEDKHYAWKDSAYMGEADLEPDSFSESMDNITNLCVAGGSSSGSNLLIDDLFVRKWIVDEPTHSDWGNVECFAIEDAWDFRKSHTIEGSIGAGTNYQVKIVVHYGIGADSGENIYCNSLCKTNFSDIRFTDDNGTTLLDYWMEEMTEGYNATFWVEVLDDLDDDVSIYVYYGNLNANSISNGEETFIFFDDFESTSIGSDPDPRRWWLGAAQDSDDYVRIMQDPVDSSNQVLCAAETGDTIANVAWTTNWTSTGPVAMGQKFRYDVDYKGYIALYNETARFFLEQLEDLGANNHQWYTGGNYYDYTPMIETTTDTWFNWEYRFSTAGMTLFDRDTDQVYSGGYVHTDSSNPIFASARYGLRHGANTWWTDDMYVRKFTSLEPTHGEWGNAESPTIEDNWKYRKSHTIEGSLGVGTNYQVKVIVHYDSGTDSGEHVYLNGLCKTNFSDIRFTDDNGTTLLDYWMEEMFEGENATFWIEVLDSLDTNVTIYLYYGNPDATSMSNGEATFLFFDDFEGDSLDTNKWDHFWDNGGDNTLTISNSELYLKAGSSGNYGTAIKGRTTFTDSYAFETRANFGGSTDYAATGMYRSTCTNPSTSADRFAVFIGKTSMQDHTVEGNGTEYVGDAVTLSEDYENYRITKDENGNNEFFEDDISIDSDQDYSTSLVSVPIFDVLNYPGLGPGELYADWVFLRKFISTGPTHGDWLGGDTVSWYHDCSNTTGFVYNDSWNMNWISWDIQPGTFASDGSTFSITNVVTGSNWHGPVFEYELPNTFRVRDIDNFTAIFDVDNSLNAYLGYEVLMLGDADRNPVMLFSFHDGWADYTQGSYGVSYVFANGSYVGHGSGYPVTWSTFNGIMNATYTDTGLLAYVDGHGEGILPGLTEVDFDREIKYIAVASARFGSDPLLPVYVDEIYLNSYYWELTEPISPTIDSPDDIEYPEFNTGNEIVWHPDDANPYSYTIYFEDALLKSGRWNSSSESIAISVDGLNLGIYNYTILATDICGHTARDEVFVTVSDGTTPVINDVQNITFSEGSTGYTITWSPTDLHPVSYEILLDDSVVRSGIWNSSGENIIVDLDGLTFGIYNYTIILTDIGGNTIDDAVIVTVTDGTPPTINNVQDMSFTEGTTGHIITWSPTDLHPASYEILLDGNTVWSGLWNSTGENIIVGLDGLATGTYNYTIIVTDVGGNTASDIVIVTVNAETTTTTTTTTTTWDWSELPDLITFLIVGMGGTIFILIIIVIYLKRSGSG